MGRVPGDRGVGRQISGHGPKAAVTVAFRGFPAAWPGARTDLCPAGSVVNLIAGPACRAHSRPADHFFI
jgi:hypothetical protein